MTTADLNKESLATWDVNSAFWDDGIGATGNIYWQRLQEPSLRRLLHRHLGRPDGGIALDLCTGNGLGARWLARQGVASVVATDGSKPMLERAMARSLGQGDPNAGGAGGGSGREGAGEGGGGRGHGTIVAFRQLDVTSREDLEREAEDVAKLGGYDIVLMNMAIMDVATLEPLASTLPKLLKRDGAFVATILHPVFFTSEYSRNIDLKFNQTTGELDVVRSKTIREYLKVPPAVGIALPGQPAKQLYFHRPIHELFTTFFKAGLVMDAMEEPAFTEEDAKPERVQASVNYTQLPAVLSFRMRRADFTAAERSLWSSS